jgi:hypothetical protein
MSVCPLVDFHMVDFLTCYFALCPMRRACAVPALSLRTPCVPPILLVVFLLLCSM